MKNKPRKAPKSVLVEFELLEVTDPAEFAALERRVRAAEKAMAEREKAIASYEARKSKARKRK